MTVTSKTILAGARTRFTAARSVYTEEICMRVTLSAIALVVAAVALAAPAQAALTAVLTPTTPSYAGACPTTMAFTGSISGPPGTAFQYSFSRYVNGVQQVQNVGAVTLPASGTVAVSDSISIAGTSAGINFDQIWVHNIAGGQPDVYSNRAPFSVTCGSGKPGVVYETTTTERGHSVIYDIPAPTNVHTTTDPKECAAHLPPTPIGVLLSPVCAEILTGGGAEIVFSWEGTAIYPDVDGFHVFNVAGHISNPGMASTAGGSNTVVFKKGPVGQACYVIRAYKGARESADSTQACVAGGSSSRTVSLNSTNVRSFRKSHNFVTGIGIAPFQNDESTTGLSVGHSYWYEKHLAGDFVYDDFSRAGALFDLKSLHANFIFKAVLHLHVTGGSHDRNSSIPTSSCASDVGLGTNTWWNGSGGIDGNFSSSTSSPIGFPDVTVDVTNEVREMITSNLNLGFVLRGSGEDLNAFTHNVCMTEYAVPAQLEVTYN
jgi:hypothetical protein